jgi:hypothetical protein
MGHGGYCAWGSTVKDLVEDMDFGACQADSGAIRCAWAPEDCVKGETYSFPVEECSCDKVRVGGCNHDGEAFCAVSADGCDEASTWFDVLGIVAETNTECHLCFASSTNPVTDPPVQSTDVPIVFVDPTQSTSTDVPLRVSPTGNDTESSSSIIIAAVASIVCVVFVLLGTSVIKRRRDQKRSGANVPPTSTLEISDNTGEDIDTVSNLDEEEFVSREEGKLS